MKKQTFDPLLFQLLECEHCRPKIEAFLRQQVQKKKRFDEEAELIIVKLLTKPDFCDFAEKLLLKYLKNGRFSSLEAETELAKLAKDVKYQKTALRLLSLDRFLSSSVQCDLLDGIDESSEITRFLVKLTKTYVSGDFIDKLCKMEENGSKAAKKILGAIERSESYLVSIPGKDTAFSYVFNIPQEWPQK